MESQPILTDKSSKGRNTMMALVQDVKAEAQNGLMGLRKPTPKRSVEEESLERERRGSQCQSAISFKAEKEKRHHRILKQVHKPKQYKMHSTRNEIVTLDPKKSCMSLSRMFETLPELPFATRDGTPCGQYSMTFTSTDESTVKERVDSFASLGHQVVNFDPVNQELILAKTPISDFAGLEAGLPFLDLNN